MLGKTYFPLHLLAQCVLQQVAIQLENAKERLCIDKITTNISSKKIICQIILHLTLFPNIGVCANYMTSDLA